MSGIRPFGCALALAVLLASAPESRAARALPSDRPHENVRPFISAGYSLPVSFGEIDRGFGIGMGFEVEQGARGSILFRFDWDGLQGDPVYSASPIPYATPRVLWPALTAMSWSIGGRGYLRTGHRFRPYAEGCLGVRVVSEPHDVSRAVPLVRVVSEPHDVSRAVALATSFGGTAYSAVEGMAGTIRLGLSAALPGRAGLFVDSGLQVIVRNPRHNGLVPFRIGIVFP